MATIGYLRLVLAASTDQLSKGLKAGSDMVNDFGAKIGSAAAGIATVGAAAGAAAVGGLAAMVKSGMDSINTTRQLAERIGTTSEALSRLQYAAQIADVPAELLGTSLEKMQIRLGEVAQTGEGKAAKALDKFGISAADLAAQDPVDTFHQLMGVLEKIESPAERAAVAVDLFGKSGAGMLNMVVQGSEAIAEMEQEADQLGVTISDIDAAKVDEADDSLTKVWDTLGAVAKRLAVELAPYITAAAEAMINFAKQGINAGDLVHQAMGWVVSAVGFVADTLQVGKAAWLAFKSAALEGISLTLQGLGWLGDKLNDFVKWLGGEQLFNTDGIKEWGKAAESAAVDTYNEMEKLWQKPWAHEAVTKAAEDIAVNAEVRANQAVEKMSKFRQTGAEVEKEAKKGEGIKYAGAYDIGSKEAYTSIMTARGLASSDKKAVQDTAKNTERTAKATESMAQFLNSASFALGFSSEADLIDNLQNP